VERPATDGRGDDGGDLRRRQLISGGREGGGWQPAHGATGAERKRQRDNGLPHARYSI
jgi:hypothetical protein